MAASRAPAGRSRTVLHVWQTAHHSSRLMSSAAKGVPHIGHAGAASLAIVTGGP